MKGANLRLGSQRGQCVDWSIARFSDVVAEAGIATVSTVVSGGELDNIRPDLLLPHGWSKEHHTERDCSR